MTHESSKPGKHVARDEALLAKHALAYPDVVEEAPWGHRAFKIKKKTFLFMGSDARGLFVSAKLPHSADTALLFPFAEPTHYGLGKSGWVTANFSPRDAIPVALMRAWIDESFRAIAPKTLLKALDAAGLAKPRPKPKPKAGSAAKAARRAGPKRKGTRKPR